MAEETQLAKSKKDTFIERHKAKHPDLDFNDEESVYGSINDDFDSFDNQMAELQSSNDKYKKDQDDFLNAMSQNKNNGQFISDMMQGKDWLDTAIGIHGYDGLIEYLSSEEAREKYKEADEKHKKSLEENEAIDKEAQKNAEETDANIQKAIEDGRFTQEQYENAVKTLFDISDGLELNVCKPEWIEMVIKADGSDDAIEKAREEGRLEGKNEGLEENIGGRKKSAAPSNAPSMPTGMGGRTSRGNGNKGGSLAQLLMK